MPETGRIVGMNVFTDGYANGVEYQDLRYNIYTDNNGQPGDIIPNLNATTAVDDHWHSGWNPGYMWLSAECALKYKKPALAGWRSLAVALIVRRPAGRLHVVGWRIRCEWPTCQHLSVELAA